MESPSMSLDEKPVKAPHATTSAFDGDRAGEDEALKFLNHHQEAGTVVDVTESKALRWKIDWHIMPLLMTIYFLQYLDKTLLNYASVMGIKKFLPGNEYNNLSTIFYVGYLVSEPFTGYLMQRFPIGKYLGINVFCWGVLVACTAACKSYASLMIVRVLLGVFEACVAPALILITGMWWTKAEQARRMGLWYMQIGVGQIVGAALSYGFQHVNSTSIDNWQILFLFMGVITAIVGIFTFFFLPDSPMKARFLTADERVSAIEHVRINNTGVENKTFKWYQIRELLLRDYQTWFLFFITLLAMIDNGAVSTFSSVIIKTFGYSNERTTIVQMPSGAVSIIATFAATYLVGAVGQRSFFIVLCCVPTILGVGLLLGLDAEQKVGKLFGVYLLNALPACLPIIYNINSANTSGYTKRTFRNALTLMAFCVGNLIGPQLFPAGDSPKYTTAKIVLLVTSVAVCVLQLALRQVLVWDNKKRDQEQEHEGRTQAQQVEFHDLTDKENRTFRYVY